MRTFVFSIGLILPAPAAWADAGADCAQIQDPDRSIRACTDIIDKGYGTRRALAAAYNNRSNAYDKMGDHDRAIVDLNIALELDPKYVRAYINRGLDFDDRGDHDRAIADYSKALELDPKNADAYNARAWAYFEAGKAAQALPDAERSLELRPNDARTLDTRGNIFEALGRRDEAIADFRRALANDPLQQESGNALKRLGASP